MSSERVEYRYIEGESHGLRSQAHGCSAQVEIFGESMADFAMSGPEYRRHVNKWLVDNCFGDYCTRDGLTLDARNRPKRREFGWDSSDRTGYTDSVA